MYISLSLICLLPFCGVSLVSSMEDESLTDTTTAQPTAAAFATVDIPPLPYGYVLPSISELAALSSLPSLPVDEGIQKMADEMQARAERLKNDLEAILAPATPVSPAVPPADASMASNVSSPAPAALNAYGGQKGNAYFSLFTEKVILPELVAYFRSLQDQPHMNEKSLERLLRVLGQIRFYLAHKTESSDCQFFGFFMADFPVQPGLILDQISNFTNWYKYFTETVLGNDFAYPYNLPVLEFIQNPNVGSDSYCQKVVANNDLIKERFFESYKDFQQLDGLTAAVVTGVPERHFIVYSRTPAYVPRFCILHAFYSASHITELLPLLLEACKEPSLEKVAHVHFFMNICSFYNRGQAAISLWILNALFALDGKKLALDEEMKKTGVNLDQFALTYLKFKDYLEFLQAHASLVPIDGSY